MDSYRIRCRDVGFSSLTREEGVLSQRFIFNRHKRGRRREQVVRLLAWSCFAVLFLMAADHALAFSF